MNNSQDCRSSCWDSDRIISRAQVASAATGVELLRETSGSDIQRVCLSALSRSPSTAAVDRCDGGYVFSVPWIYRVRRNERNALYFSLPTLLNIRGSWFSHCHTGMSL